MDRYRFDVHPVVVLSALRLEYQAVRDRLTGIRQNVPVAGTRFETGSLPRGAGDVVLGLTGDGAAVVAGRAVAQFSPVALLFVGVTAAARRGLALGDVVVATRVYAEDGAAHAWELDHGIEQAARQVERAGSWTARDPRPAVHFGAVAAAAPPRGARPHHDDALAVEGQAGGVAEAGRLNAAPVAVIRGVSDRSDGGRADTERWQPRAAGNAAAFALALAAALIARGKTSSKGRRAMPEMVHNSHDNARVGAAVGVTAAGAGGPGVDELIARLGVGLRRAYVTSRLDQATYEAAETELAAVTEHRDPMALKRLRGLVDEIPELVEQVRVIGRLW